MSITALGPIAAIIADLVDDVHTSEEERLRFALKLKQLEQAGALAQIGVNSNEATSKSIFVAGWRPAVGWVCASAFAWAYIVSPFLIYANALFGGEPLEGLPELDLGAMMPVMMGMLGLAATRTVEKTQGVASETWSTTINRSAKG